MTTIDLLNSTAPVRAFQLTTHLKSGYSVALLERGLAHKTIKGWVWILHDRDETTDNLHCVFWCERDPGLETLSRWRVPSCRTRVFVLHPCCIYR